MKHQAAPKYVGLDFQRPRSFSSLMLFEQCPRAFMNKYCTKPEVPEQENAHAQYGKLAHVLLEEWAKDELMDADLAPEWEKRYRQYVRVPFPKSNEDRERELFQAGIDYFSHFHGFGEEWEILAVEERYLSIIDGFRFTGIADLLLRHRESGNLMVVDHKSKTKASMKRDLDKCYKQLYLYSGMVKEKYGQFPSLLTVNAIRANDLYSIPFCLEDYRRTIDWATDLAAQILVETEFPRNKSWYFCNFICSTRDFCAKQKMQENIENGDIEINPFGLDV